MSISHPPHSSGLREARDYLERARARCQDACAAQFLELILQKVDLRIDAADGQASTPPELGGQSAQGHR